MTQASPAGLVSMWERADGLRGAERARVLLDFDAAARTGADAWTLGRRDAVLARIYASLYGEGIEATVRCAACEAFLEFETTVGTLFDAVSDDRAEPGAFCVRHDGYAVTLRPLCIADISGLPSASARAFETILRRCVIDARHDAVAVDADMLPAEVRAAVSAALGVADPRAETLVTLACTECGTADRIAFDIGAFLWEALERSVTQLFADVHVLAAAYGWSERDILALSDNRRRRYLELVLR